MQKANYREPGFTLGYNGDKHTKKETISEGP